MEPNEMQGTANSGIKALTTTHPMTEQTRCIHLLFAGQPICTQFCAGHRKYTGKRIPFLQEPKAVFSSIASQLAQLLKYSLCQSVCLSQLKQLNCSYRITNVKSRETGKSSHGHPQCRQMNSLTPLSSALKPDVLTTALTTLSYVR